MNKILRKYSIEDAVMPNPVENCVSILVPVVEAGDSFQNPSCVIRIAGEDYYVLQISMWDMINHGLLADKSDLEDHSPESLYK